MVLSPNVLSLILPFGLNTFYNRRALFVQFLPRILAPSTRAPLSLLDERRDPGLNHGLPMLFTGPAVGCRDLKLSILRRAWARRFR